MSDALLPPRHCPPQGRRPGSIRRNLKPSRRPPCREPLDLPIVRDSRTTVPGNQPSAPVTAVELLMRVPAPDSA
jgi:hypothetical protein